MSSKVSLIALGVGVYLAIAIVSFPASVAERWFAPDALQLAGVEGTVWRGRAAHGAVSGFGFANLEWQLDPVALVTGRLDVTAETDFAGGAASARLEASGSRLVLTEVEAVVNLLAFRALLPLGEVRGDASLALERLELVDGWPVAVQGEIAISGLAMPPIVPMPDVTRIPLGNYVAQFTPSGEPGTISALIRDQGGPLELTGHLTLTADRNYILDTLIRPRADAPSVLVQGLELVTAPPNAEGFRKFVEQGTL